MKDVILLTGAGFTYNFGGFLGKDMWLRIFNNPLTLKHDRVRELLLKDNDFDYESVYAQIIGEDKYSEFEKNAIKTVVEEAYSALNFKVESFMRSGQEPDGRYLMDFLKDLLYGDDERFGFFFTLNQDLLIDWYPNIYMPWISLNSTNPNSIAIPRNYSVSELEREVDDNPKKIKYIKLHGSYGWLSSNHEHAMAIGYNKFEYIQKEPLLFCYYQKFQAVINEGNKRLLIIGYSFRDEHINRILQDGVMNHGLRLYIINPLDLRIFKQELFKRCCADDLWAALHGYFPYTLKQIIPFGQEGKFYQDDIFSTLTS